METSFKIPPNISQSLLHEVLLNAAKLNPDYPYILTLNSDVPDSKIEIITYTRFVSDVSQVAKRLQRSIPRRKPGSEIQNVGILARNGYDYAVHWMTCQFNSWSVSFWASFSQRLILILVSLSCYLPEIVERRSYTFSAYLVLLTCSWTTTIFLTLRVLNCQYPSSFSKISQPWKQRYTPSI